MANGNGPKATTLGADLYNEKAAAIARNSNVVLKETIELAKSGQVAKDPVALAICNLSKAVSCGVSAMLVQTCDGSAMTYHLSRVIGPAIVAMAQTVDGAAPEMSDGDGADSTSSDGPSF